MKKLITYLKTLWRRGLDSQSTDVSLDCRLTVGSPSGFSSKSLLKLVSVLVLILTIGSGNVWGVTYTKITSTSGLPSDGNSAKYLIVYESLNYVYDGSKTGSDLGASGDYKTAGNSTFSRSSSVITINGTDNFYFTISRSGNNYIIQSASGYYIGRTDNSNGINQSTTDSYNHTITFSSNNAQITSSAGPKLQFLNNSGSYTFKYYKSSQQLVQLYKEDASSFTITYNANGGSGSMSNTTGASVSAASCTFTPPTGKVFSSWNTQAGGGGTSYAAGASVNATVTLYAQWVSDWELTYGVSGSSWGDPAAMTVTDGVASCNVSLSAMTKYEFKFHKKSTNTYYGNSGGVIITDISDWGFGTDGNNCRLFSGPSGSYTFSWDVSASQGDVTYPSVSHPATGYAYFRKQGSDTYIKVYTHHNSSPCEVANWEGSVQVNNKTEICGADYFYFALTDAGGCSKAIIRYNSDGSQKGDFTITSGAYSGKWGSVDDTNWHEFTTYGITFDGNGSTGGSMTDVNGICPNGSTTLVANGYSRTGYDFNGWNTQAGGGGTSYANLATISSINADIDLYAQWSAKTISITLDKNNNDASGSTSGSTSIKYDATAVLSSPTHATRTGYTLEGYYAESGCTNKVMTNAGVLVNYTGYVVGGQWKRATTPTTLYAKWTVNSYTVTWSVEGTTTGTTNVNYGSKVASLPSTPESTCEGTFVGWTTSADAVYDKNVTDNYTTTPTVFTNVAGSPTITGDITFYAVFKKRMED